MRSYAKGMVGWRRAVAIAALLFSSNGCDPRFSDKTTAPFVDAAVSLPKPAAAPGDAGGSAPVLVEMGRLLDGVTPQAKDGQAILVADGRIVDVGPRDAIEKEAPLGTKVVDLGSMTVLPGLIDAHTHVLLQGDPTAADYDEQLLKESIPYRAIRATASARTALLNGSRRSATSSPRARCMPTSI